MARAIVVLTLVTTVLLHLVSCGQKADTPEATPSPATTLSARPTPFPTTTPSATPTPFPTTTLSATPTPFPTLRRPALLAKEELFLRLVSPVSTEVVVNQSSIEIIGRTRVDALVTVGDYVIEPDIEGWFRQEMELDPGANIIEVIVSVANGEEKSQVLAVIYVP